MKNVRRELAKVARMSDDPDTPIGCIAILASGHRLAVANQFPDGVEITPERLEKPAKYAFIGHAEDGIITMAARLGLSTHGATMFLDWFPCAPCARSVVKAGVYKIFCNKERYDERKDDPRYQFAEALYILVEGGVIVEWLQ